MTRRALPRRAAGRVLAGLGLCALLGTALPGCGFQLRGNYRMAFRTLWAAFPAGSSVEPEFIQAMGFVADTRLVRPPARAEAKLDVLQELREKEITAFSSTGRPREYEIRLRFRFRVLDDQGDDWAPPAEITLRRTITATDSTLAAKGPEEVFLYRDMTTDLVQQLMWRLAALKR